MIWIQFLLLFLCQGQAQVYQSAGESFQFQVLAQQKDVVWGFDFLGDDRIIFTERSGAMRILNLQTNAITTLTGVPKVWSRGQGGLLDVRVHPKESKRIYFTYSEPVGDGKATTTLAVAEVEKNHLENVRKLFSAHEANSNGEHFGSRIEFDGDFVFVTVGDRGERNQAQDMKYHMGKVLRLDIDGSVPKDNPFVNAKGAKPEIWSLGHRSPQGLVLHPVTKKLWLAEMGPRGGDEINVIEKGANYGWPKATFGNEYYGPKIGKESLSGMMAPVTFWKPSISPSAMTFYTGGRFPKWKNHAFLANLSGQHLRRLKIEGDKVIEQEALLSDLNLRFRNVRPGDGYLYVSTDDGKIARLTPAVSKSSTKK